MKGDRPARLVLPARGGGGDAGGRSPRGARSGRAREATESLPPEAEPVFEALRLLRLELAREESVPAFVVASDRTLRDIALLRPRRSTRSCSPTASAPPRPSATGRRSWRSVARASAPR